MHIETSNQSKIVLGFGDYTCNWGTHLCGLFESELERDEIIYGLLEQGVRDDSRQFYVHLSDCEHGIKEKLGLEFKGNDQCLAKANQISFFNAEDYYYSNGNFSVPNLKQNWINVENETQKLGPANLRAIGEMPSTVQLKYGLFELASYESWINEFIVDKPFLFLCLYNVNDFSGATIMQVLQTHPFIINKSVITANPFYTPPDEWFEKNKNLY